jgi:transposase
MSMGKRKRRARQASMWVATQDLPRSASHPFYRRLNRVLDNAQFDAFVEGACATFYAEVMGRPSLAPGRYFRLLLLGYFEGLDSERAIAWRAADSLSVRSFLDLDLQEPTPDHSTISRTRRLIDLEIHRAVFTWVPQRLADAGLVKGTTVDIDATDAGGQCGTAQCRAMRHRRVANAVDARMSEVAETPPVPSVRSGVPGQRAGRCRPAPSTHDH